MKTWIQVCRFVVAALLVVVGVGPARAQMLPVEEDFVEETSALVKGVSLRFHPRSGRRLVPRSARGPAAAAASVSRELTAADAPGRPAATNAFREDEHEGRRDLQINDPRLDHVQAFAGTRPFEFSIQSETSTASFGRNIVVGYNSSADSPIIQLPQGLFFEHIHFSAYSTSNDGGHSWKSGFIPPPVGSLETDGDPSLGVDRRGNFYYASLGADADGFFALIVGKSSDRGRTFAPAVVAAVDDGSDKEWLAVGPDPAVRRRDNLYLTWTSFQDTGGQLRFTRSTDGGQTWSPQQILFAPEDDGVMSAFVQFSNPVVDASNGRLYIPFLHFSNFDSDMVRVLVSDDGGGTFRFLRFDVAGAPDAFAFPNVTPGPIIDCGSGGFRQVLHQGADLGGGQFGLPRFRQATRLITQPSAAAANGRLFIALNSSTSPFFGDPTANSEIRLVYSRDGGNAWRSLTVAPVTALDWQHVHPAVSTDREGEHVQVAYYVQQSDERMRTDLLSAEVSRRRLKLEEVGPLSRVAFDLIPSNNPIPTPANPFRTTNYDRLVQPCYAIGEYMSVVSKGEERTRAAWGDLRKNWTSPPGSPLFGTPLATHAQPDVFFKAGGEE